MGIDRNNYQIGIYLEKALQRKHLTTKELSDLSGVDITNLRKFLINESSPSLTTIKKIAKALDMDVEYFTNDFYYKDGAMKASILSNDLILHIDESNEKDLRKAYKAISRMINQSFNSVSLKGKKEIVESLYLLLTSDIYTITYNSKNPDKNYWKHLYSDDTLLRDMFGISEKDYAKFRVTLDNLFSPNVDDEEKEGFLNNTLDKINTKNQLQEQKKDDN